MCVCNNQLQPHDLLPGACTDEPADRVQLTAAERQRAAAERLASDPMVLAYDELDLRLMADMEGGH